MNKEVNITFYHEVIKTSLHNAEVEFMAMENKLEKAIELLKDVNSIIDDLHEFCTIAVIAVNLKSIKKEVEQFLSEVERCLMDIHKKQDGLM